MTKKAFNWNYKTAHRMGESRVRDDKHSTWATFTGNPDELDQPLPRSQRTHELTDTEWEQQNR